jgi:3-oxoacyl-[acyl-carrier protein] reductase
MGTSRKSIIVGASSGLGLESTISLLKNSSEVLAVVRDGQKILSELSQHSGLNLDLLTVLETDLALETEREKLIKDIRIHGKNYDSLLFAAGMGFGRRLGMISPTEITTLMETNVYSFVQIMQGLVRFMANPSSVVVVSSFSSGYSQAGNSVYGASKAALERLTTSFAVEYVQSGIRFNAISPTLIDTPMLKQMDSLSQEAVLSFVGSDRALKSPEVVNVVDFLFSRESLAINGQVIRLGTNLGWGD